MLTRVEELENLYGQALFPMALQYKYYNNHKKVKFLYFGYTISAVELLPYSRSFLILLINSVLIVYSYYLMIILRHVLIK